MTAALGPDFSLDERKLAAFEGRGYSGPFQVYDPKEIRSIWQRERLRLLDRRHAVYQDDHTRSGAINIANYDRHLDSRFFADHICRPQIVDRVVSVLGRDVLCWRTEFFPKYPGDEGTDWHQAATFANASGAPQIAWPPEANGFGGTITVWTALTEARITTGCLQFQPGTHRTMLYDETKGMDYDAARVNRVEKAGVRRGFFGYDYRQLQIDPDWSPDQADAISIEMEAGEAVMFWSTLLHASHPHLGLVRDMRLGFAARYVPTCVRVYPRGDAVAEYGGSIALDRYGAVLVAGQDRFGHNRMATRTTRGYAFGPRRRAL